MRLFVKWLTINPFAGLQKNKQQGFSRKILQKYNKYLVIAGEIYAILKSQTDYKSGGQKMSKTIMAIGAHIGDAELTAGGVLATAALEGAKIVTLALTAGERGNPPGVSVADYRIQKVKEAKEFAKRLGGEAIVFPYKDGELPDSDEAAFMLCDEIRRVRPDTLITHWKNSLHIDHAAAHRITQRAQFYAGLKSMERALPNHYAEGPYYAENWEDTEDFTTYIFAQVSEEGFKLWSEAINCHWFAVNSPYFKYKEYYSHLKRVRGLYAGKEYAECFQIDGYKHKVVRSFCAPDNRA